MTEAENKEPRYFGEVIGVSIRYPFESEDISLAAFIKHSDILLNAKFEQKKYAKFEEQIDKQIFQQTQHWGNKQDLFLKKLSYEHQKLKEAYLKSQEDIDDQLSGRKPLSPQNQQLKDQIYEKFAEKNDKNKSKYKRLDIIFVLAWFVIVICIGLLKKA